MQQRIGKLMAAAAVAALAGQLWAGGFWLQLGTPEANPEARKANAALVIKAVGCHDPARAQVSARAVGVVDGKRQVIPLKVTALNEPGTFALARQWPEQGKWVIELTGKNAEQFTNTLVSAGPSGIDRLHAKADMKAFAESDIEAMLR
jgi:hypothetical protein